MRKGAEQEPAHLVAPGDVITRDSGFMRGHGTYMAPGEEVNNYCVLLYYYVNKVQSKNIAINSQQSELVLFRCCVQV